MFPKAQSPEGIPLPGTAKLNLQEVRVEHTHRWWQNQHMQGNGQEDGISIPIEVSQTAGLIYAPDILLWWSPSIEGFRHVLTP